MQASECIKKTFRHVLLKILNLIHFKVNKFSYRCFLEKLLAESMKPTFSFIFGIKNYCFCSTKIKIKIKLIKKLNTIERSYAVLSRTVDWIHTPLYHMEALLCTSTKEQFEN